MAGRDSRRLALRVALKSLALATLAALAFPFVASLIPAERPKETLALEVERLTPEQLLRTEWQGRRLLVLRRSERVRQQLAALETALADPLSRHSEQPDAMVNPFRSAEAEFFVALDYDPDFGCPLEYVPPAGPAPFTPWAGGFRAPCSESWFDPAGRVYRNQRTLHNLRVPRHHLTGGRLVLEE